MTSVMKPEQQNIGLPVMVDDAGDTAHDYALRPPILVLAQAQSEAGTPGKFRRTDNGEEFEELDVIALTLRATRVKWPTGEFSRDRKPECWSSDGARAGAGARFEGQDCMTCPHRLASIWEPDPKAEKCLPTHAVIFLEAYTFEPLLFQLNNKSTARLASIIRGNLRRAIMKLSVEQVTSNQGKFFAPRMKTIGKLQEDDLAIVEERFRQLGRQAVAVYEGQEEEAAPAESSPAAPAPAPANVDPTPRAALFGSKAF